jgi:hypothetical protein
VATSSLDNHHLQEGKKTSDVSKTLLAALATTSATVLGTASELVFSTNEIIKPMEKQIAK